MSNPWISAFTNGASNEFKLKVQAYTSKILQNPPNVQICESANHVHQSYLLSANVRTREQRGAKQTEVDLVSWQQWTRL